MHCLQVRNFKLPKFPSINDADRPLKWQKIKRFIGYIGRHLKRNRRLALTKVQSIEAATTSSAPITLNVSNEAYNE